MKKEHPIPANEDSETSLAEEKPAEEVETGETASTALKDPLEALQEELAQARAQADEYLDGWQRSRAEFANYKKRIEREQDQLYQAAAGAIIKRYLEILDDLERALKNKPQDGEGAAWAEGIELIYRKLQAMLESEGVKSFTPEGQMFDPNMHEAILSEDSDHHESGQIIEVLQPGYMIGDKVLRPAMVRVAR